jgi:hypothetical protein
VKQALGAAGTRLRAFRKGFEKAEYIFEPERATSESKVKKNEACTESVRLESLTAH